MDVERDERQSNEPSRSEQILDCHEKIKLWKNRLGDLVNDLRRDTLLVAAEYDPEWVWQQLSLEEKKGDKALVHKILSTGTDMFGASPWDDRDFRRYEFPVEFMADPQAVLTFVSSEKFQKSHRRFAFVPPFCLRDHQEVLKAVCAFNAVALSMASPRLQDDKDIVRTAMLCQFRDYEHYDKFEDLDAFQFASDRLRRDPTFICDLIGSDAGAEGEDEYERFRWFRYASLADLATHELHQIATAIRNNIHADNFSFSMGFLSSLPPILRDAKEFMLDLVRADIKSLQFCGESICSDKEAMLPVVQSEWRALQWCGNNLRADAEVVKVAVSQNPNAFEFALGEVLHSYLMERTVNSVLEELSNGLSFRNVPDAMRSHREVILAGLKAGQREHIYFGELPDEQRHDKEFVVSFIEAYGKFDEDSELLYHELSDDLQRDEGIGLVLLRNGYYDQSILDNIPSLWNSRDAMMGTTNVLGTRRDGHTYIYSSSFLRKCQFRDDEEFMLAACAKTEEILEYASPRLLSDHAFMWAAWGVACTGWFITFSPWDFQNENSELVMKSLEMYGKHGSKEGEEDLFGHLSGHIWTRRDVVLAYLKLGRPFFIKHETEFPFAVPPHSDDPEVVQISTAIDPSELQYASVRLRKDRGFVLDLVRENGRCLEYSRSFLMDHDDILTAAVANSKGALLGWIREFVEFDVPISDAGVPLELAGKIRSKLQVHDSFVKDFLRGISICDQSHVPPANRCLLPRLNRGAETCTAWKRRIAEYADVPLGAEVHLLRAACANLTECGF